MQKQSVRLKPSKHGKSVYRAVFPMAEAKYLWDRRREKGRSSIYRMRVLSCRNPFHVQ